MASSKNITLWDCVNNFKIISEEDENTATNSPDDVKVVVENGKARLELTKWDPEVKWTEVTKQGDLSKPQMSALREEALIWRHGFEKELARGKMVRGRMQERRAISDSIEQVLQLLFVQVLAQ